MDADEDAARPWIDAAQPSFVTLIDRHHLLSSLYNMVNVPQAVWIDEQGRVVRPPESGGSIDILREFDLAAGAFKPEALARSQAAKATYVEAVKDWAINGAGSRFAFDPDEARAHVSTATPEIMLAHAKFRLGQYLLARGREAEATACFAEARALHPDSWNIFRETSEKLETGIAGAAEFWEKVAALGEKAYYAPVDMEGMP